MKKIALLVLSMFTFSLVQFAHAEDLTDAERLQLEDEYGAIMQKLDRIDYYLQGMEQEGDITLGVKAKSWIPYFRKNNEAVEAYYELTKAQGELKNQIGRAHV